MYDDIIDIVYPFDLNRKRMSEYDRCKQFMPFSALVGYKEAVIETARLTNDRVILDENAREILDDKLNKIREKLSFEPVATITYFIPDRTKSGGNYNKITGIIKRIDLYKNFIVINDNKIHICDIMDIDF